MDYIVFRRDKWTSTRKGRTLCSSCMLGLTNLDPDSRECWWLYTETWFHGKYYSPELGAPIPRGWHAERVQGAHTCTYCYSRIMDVYPEFKTVEKSWDWCRPLWHSSRWDTRRIAASGKMIGNGNGRTWGSAGRGKYYKKMLHKAERRYYNKYARAYISDPEMESRIVDGSLKVWNSEVNWKGT